MVNDSINFRSQYLEFHDYLDSICLDKDIGLSSSLFNFGDISIGLYSVTKFNINFSTSQGGIICDFSERNGNMGEFNFSYKKVDNFFIEEIKSSFHYRYITTSSGAIAGGVIIFSLSNLFSLLQMVLGYYCRVDIRNNKISIILRG